jgi:hypothetical protein
MNLQIQKIEINLETLSADELNELDIPLTKGATGQVPKMPLEDWLMLRSKLLKNSLTSRNF